MSALQAEIKAAVQEATAPLMRELSDLRRIVEAQSKDAQPEYVTVKEAAKILKCTEKTVHRYCDSGRLEVRRDGHKKLITYASLIETAG
ncbi:helix-turn-helix domain-containing protein [Tritonibacter mobilis]|uniref:helix-turn-helix domain-containing protein n=1 Tax=Tritonibacter mobilis TaxID=379347 RepID=UPI000F7FA3D5|nr:helix-turn-helix domain-containing protein [Tritonibacter mobilis]